MMKCLAIIDVQKGFINESTQHIPALVEDLQKKYEFVIATRFFNPEGSFFRKLILWEKFDLESSEFQLAFCPEKHVIILDKPLYTFVNDRTIKYFKDHHISEVHICGIDTDICVTKAAVDLFEAGIVPVVLAGYCASHAGKTAHENALLTLQRFIGKRQIRYDAI